MNTWRWSVVSLLAQVPFLLVIGMSYPTWPARVTFACAWVMGASAGLSIGYTLNRRDYTALLADHAAFMLHAQRELRQIALDAGADEPRTH